MPLRFNEGPRNRIGILLSGCGAYDGSDPEEVIISILCLEENNFYPILLSIEEPQMQVVDHTTTEAIAGERCIFKESARLASTKIFDIREFDPLLLKGLIVVGGQGVVKNLIANFGDTNERKVIPAVSSFIKAINEAKKPVGAVSLGEFLISAIFGGWQDGKGCLNLKYDEILSDTERLLFLTPGHTICNKTIELKTGISNLIKEMEKYI